MKSTFVNILIIVILYSCNTEKQRYGNNVGHESTMLTIDSVSNISNQNHDYITDEFGTRSYFDSSHFSIIRRWNSDSILMLESITDNNTKIDSWKEYYANGKMKKSGKMTSPHHYKIGTWKYYSEAGKLDSTVNYDREFPISYEQALSIAQKKGFIMPEIEIYQTIEDNKRYWEIIRWGEISDNGQRKGEVMLIDIVSGNATKLDDEIVSIYCL